MAGPTTRTSLPQYIPPYLPLTGNTGTPYSAPMQTSAPDEWAGRNLVFQMPVEKGLNLAEWATSPIASYKKNKALKATLNGKETLGQRLAMAEAIKTALPLKYRNSLNQLIQAGKLSTLSDDGHSGLYHLYQITQTPRAEGLPNSLMAAEVLRILAAPETLTQQLGKLNPHNKNRILNYLNGPNENPNADHDVSETVTQEELDAYSATCVATSTMYDQVVHNTANFIRQISGLTSPDLAFYQDINSDSLSPENPAEAKELIDYYGIDAKPKGNNQYQIKIGVTEGGLIWAQNQVKHAEGYADLKPKDLAKFNKLHLQRGPIEALYQAALTKSVNGNPETGKYIDGLDAFADTHGDIKKIQSGDGQLVADKGLTADKVVMMNRLMNPQKSAINVTYMMTQGSPYKDETGEYGSGNYALGYKRRFDQIANDLKQAIDEGSNLIIGFVETDKTGEIFMAHEQSITQYKLKSYRKDDVTGELVFDIYDPGDDNPKLLTLKASEIIPKIHHVIFPAQQGLQILKTMEATMPANNYMLPVAEDAKNYELMPLVPTADQPAFLKAVEQKLREEQNLTLATPEQPRNYYTIHYPVSTPQTWPTGYYPAYTLANSNSQWQGQVSAYSLAQPQQAPASWQQGYYYPQQNAFRQYSPYPN
jgi:hypothetical protein